MKFLLGMKITSSGWCYVTFKSVFVFWDIQEHDFKNGWNFCFNWKITSSEGYHVTFKKMFAFWVILEHDLKKG